MPETPHSLHLPQAQPIAPLLDDATVTDILIQRGGEVYAERDGLLAITEYRFNGEGEVRVFAEAIAAACGRTIDTIRPLLDARLEDGSRVNIICPPLSIDGTSISIRRFTRPDFSLQDMVDQEGMSEELMDFFALAVRSRLNILVSGGTGAGKTTLLNALSKELDDDERIVTIEDTAELKLQNPDVVRLETVGNVTSADLLRNALRMRPDRILLGEVRGGEAFDMLQAMNTGHEGSITTLHANHPRDALTRLENMVNMSAPALPLRALRSQIASAVQIIVQVSRMADGIRRVTFVTELCGMEGDVILTQELVEYNAAKSGWKWSGITPRFSRRASYWGEGERFIMLFGRS